MEAMHRLQQSIGIGSGIGTCIGIGITIRIGTCSGTCIGIGAGAHDVDYCLRVYGLVRFRDRIYVPDSSELKKVILRKFHEKP